MSTACKVPVTTESLNGYESYRKGKGGTQEGVEEKEKKRKKWSVLIMTRALDCSKVDTVAQVATDILEVSKKL